MVTPSQPLLTNSKILEYLDWLNQSETWFYWLVLFLFCVAAGGVLLFWRRHRRRAQQSGPSRLLQSRTGGRRKWQWRCRHRNRSRSGDGGPTGPRQRQVKNKLPTISLILKRDCKFSASSLGGKPDVNQVLKNDIYLVHFGLARAWFSTSRIAK